MGEPFQELTGRQTVPSQQLAAPPVLALADLQSCPGGHLKNLPHAILGLGGALQVANGADPVGHVSALFGFNRLLQVFKHRQRGLNCGVVIKQKPYSTQSAGKHTCFILASSLRVCSSFLRSFLLPTRMMGTLGQKCFTSGVHFSGMFSAEIK